MITSDRLNAILEKIGSPHRAYPGGLVDQTLMHVVEALPAYVEKLVAEEVKRQLSDREKAT